jgi:hypothetical protein
MKADAISFFLPAIVATPIKEPVPVFLMIFFGHYADCTAIL